MSEWVLDHIWLDRSQSLRKFSERQLGIPVEVKSTHDCSQLMFDRLVTDSFEEPADRGLVQDLVVLIVDCLECSSDTELRELLQILL